ncbi:hypothetical protein Thal_1537 [Thermocrinis albus DSM 14484]|uniref:Transmembrane protein n=1 Tax=Thermocrinis albus (strain DSM 14484 / JCM 11386 / HI 11/12) TaxID=638303 RepID=D3SN36_THEAH|nr:DUF454 family protein [Thermocrinis albus]ADC90166.1 hypothetical protein Thal_1537 [Thermocrinis albus DSM 14484]
MKVLYRFLAATAVLMAILGMFLPLVPTVPFLLLALFFLSKSSKRDIVRLKRLPILGERIYSLIKKRKGSKVG